MEREILSGNINTYLEVRQELVFPFVAQKVRFIPYSVYPRTVCMRVELYGCAWEHASLSAPLFSPPPIPTGGYGGGEKISSSFNPDASAPPPNLSPSPSPSPPPPPLHLYD
ncbi:hypothetical protein M8J77_004380 [Diaphorina citri]|nr:hypothetical protein M8J77_004380 [Diaphorina citri]